MATTSLVKTILYKSLAEGVYQNVVTRSSSYFYFLGKTLSWDDENNPDIAINTNDQLNKFHRELLLGKRIKTTDISSLVALNLWETGTVYDQYDDIIDISKLKIPFGVCLNLGYAKILN